MAFGGRFYRPPPPRDNRGERILSKVEERRQREAFDRDHPWLPLSEAVPRGAICEVLFSDEENGGDQRFFLHSDGAWYRIDPPEKQNIPGGWGRAPMNWRATGEKLSPARREEIVAEANKRGW